MNLPKIARCIVRAPAYCGLFVSFGVIVMLVLLVIVAALVALFFSRASGMRVG